MTIDHDVAFFVGQSNMVGYQNDGPAPYTPTARVQIWVLEAKAFHYMQPGVNTGTANSPDVWGPEVGYANRWLAENPTGTLFIGKYAKGSTSMADWQEGGVHFETAAAMVRDMQANLGQDVDQLFIMQGETDAMTAPAALAHYDLLTEFRFDFREETQNPDLFITQARIDDNTPYFEWVRWAQVVSDLNDPLGTSFDTHHLTTWDGLHFDPQSLLVLGNLFWEASQDLVA